MVRKHKSGDISVATGSGNPLPDEHGFTDRFLIRAVEEGYGTLHLTLETPDGAVVYQIVGANRADPAPGQEPEEAAITEFRGELIEQPSPKKRGKRG